MLEVKDQAITPKQVREMLNADNSEIKNLCRKSSLIPKRDENGNTFFSSRDVEILRKAKEAYNKAREVEKQLEKKIVQNPPIAKIIPQVQAPVSFAGFEDSIVQKLTSVIEEKMEGIDEVVIELIRAKTENESLRNKMNDLNKELYRAKAENQSYKHVVAGFYVKKEASEYNF